MSNSAGKFFGFDSGHVHFKHGKHSFFVRTKRHPLMVWVEKKDHGHSACCQSPKNWLAWEASEHGIHFSVIVESGSMEVKWAVTKYHCDSCGELDCDDAKTCEC